MKTPWRLWATIWDSMVFAMSSFGEALAGLVAPILSGLVVGEIVFMMLLILYLIGALLRG